MRDEPVIHLDLDDPDDLETEGGRIDGVRHIPVRPARRLPPLVARLRDATGPTGSRVTAATAGEVQALASAVIAEALVELLGEEGCHG